MFCSKCGREIPGTYCSHCGVFNADIGEPTAGVVLAGWWQRVGATIFDSLILLVPVTVLDLLLGAVLGTVASIGVQGVYMVMLLARPEGQTIGNRVVRTQVRDALTGHAIAYQQALRRWGLVALYSVFDLTQMPGPVLFVSFIGLVDCLFPLFDRRKQTLHDKFAGTIVVKL